MSQPSSAVAERPDSQETGIVPWREALKDQGGALHAFLPTDETRNRFLRVVAQAIERNPDLQECTPASLASAAVEAAMYGLEPSGAAGGAHLVPFSTKVKRGGREVWEKRAQLIVDYRGQLQLARDSEKVEDAYAVVVREKDHFRYDAANGLIEHVPDLQAAQSPNPDDAANRMTHVYGVLVFRSGYRRVEVMSKAQVDAVRAMSKAANGPAWTGSYLEMAKKTVMHRALKTAPLRAGARAILERDPDFDFGSQPRVTVERVNGSGSVADRLRSRRLALTGGNDPGESDAGAAALASGAVAEGSAIAPSAGSPACAHDPKKQKATDAGVVCGDCGTVLAARTETDGAGRTETDARPRPRGRKAKEKPALAPGDEGYGTARAHAVAAERGLDHGAVHRIAADVLSIDEGDLAAFSVKDLTEADWEPVIGALNEAPTVVTIEGEDVVGAADKASAEEFAGRMALLAGMGSGDNPWEEAEPAAAEMFGVKVDELTASHWREFGIRIAARNPLP